MRSSPTPGRGELLLLLLVAVVLPAEEVGACMPMDRTTDACSEMLLCSFNVGWISSSIKRVLKRTNSAFLTI
jgi:hypothetical protein